MPKTPAPHAAASPTTSRDWLASRAKALAKQGVGPREIDVEELTAPIPVLRAKVAAKVQEFQERNAGLSLADAAAQIAAELLHELKGLPPDFRTLRRRPQALHDLQTDAIEQLSTMHAVVHRQARGAVMREMARKFGSRGGNSIPELLTDARAFLAAAGDPELVAAFDLAEVDLAELRAVEAKLARVAAADASRDGANEEQLTKIDQLRLQLDAWYLKLSSVAGRVYRGDPEGRVAFLKLLPRLPRSAKQTTPATGAGEPASGTAAPSPAASSPAAHQNGAAAPGSGSPEV